MKDFKKMVKMAPGGSVSTDYLYGAKTPLGVRATEKEYNKPRFNEPAELGARYKAVGERMDKARDEADAEAQRESTRGISPENRKKRGGKVTKKKK